MTAIGLTLAIVVSIPVLGCDSTPQRRKEAPTSADVEASSTSSAAPGPRVVKLKKRSPAVGDKETHERRSETKTKVDPREAKDGVTESTDVYVVEKTEECLEVRDGVCSKLKVTYKTDTVDEEKTTQNGTTRTHKALPNEGKSYVVTRSKTTPTIQLDGGETPSKPELDAVWNAYTGDGSDERDLLAALPDTVKIGASLDDFAKVLVAQRGWTMTPAVSAMVVGIRDEGDRTIITLATRLELVSGAQGVDSVRLRTRGTMDLVADGAMVIRSEEVRELESPTQTMTTRQTLEITPGG